jgi:dynactin-4
VPANHHIFIPTAHFTVGALKDAWAYDEEDEDEGGSDDGLGGVADAVKGRMSLGAHRHRGRESGIEKRGNVTKVGLEVEVYKEASGPVEVSPGPGDTRNPKMEGSRGDYVVPG